MSLTERHTQLEQPYTDSCVLLEGIIAPSDSDSPAVKVPWKKAKQLAKVLTRQNPDTLLRVQRVGDRSTNLFFSTLFHSIISLRVAGVPSIDGAVSLAQGSSSGIQRFIDTTAYSPEIQKTRVDLGPVSTFSWLGALPTVQGYELREELPLKEFRTLFSNLESEQKNNGGPSGMAPSLLDQPLITISTSGMDDDLVVTGQEIIALGSSGLLQESPMDYARVSTTAQWGRIDTPYASLYFPRPGTLSRVP